jgi:hypothetical protein
MLSTSFPHVELPAGARDEAEQRAGVRELGQDAGVRAADELAAEDAAPDALLGAAVPGQEQAGAAEWAEPAFGQEQAGVAERAGPAFGQEPAEVVEQAGR